MPELGVSVFARAPVSKRDGGRVVVEGGLAGGAELSVMADAHPSVPDGYEWAKSRRNPSARDKGYDGADAIRPFNEFAAAGDHLTSAWDDFTAYIGTQTHYAPGKPIRLPPGLASQVVLVGPYRELFNAPATVWLPYDKGQDPAALVPVIWNDVSKAFETVLPVPGGAPPRIDTARGRIGFDTQVLGVFALVRR